MRNKILSAFLSLVILLSLAGCGNQTVRQNSDKTVNGTSPADVTSDTDINDGITAEEIKTNPTAATTEKETTAPLFETPVTNLQKNPVKTSEPAKQTAEPNPPKPQKDTGIPRESAVSVTEKPTQTAYESETESSETDTPPAPKPTEKPKPTETSAPVTETEPAFDIDYWISYAQNYAKSVGLRLESSAVDCWDNPIPANAKCKYLERDIKSRLNRYAKDKDITDVWIWAEKVSDNSYEIYIGYA